jgi:3-isopropylmalate/(R)-2-methylmalate dehydratase small subunit
VGVRVPFQQHAGIAAPLRWTDVNTDDIFPGPVASPIARLRAGAVLTDRARMGENAFAAHRWTDTGAPRPEFVLNRPPYDRATIIVAGANFGCGSSREAAVWCLAGIGIRCVIAPSFGDIFYGNCIQNGLLPIRLPDDAVERLLSQAERALDGSAETRQEPRVAVDLEACTVTAPDGQRFTFEIADYHREALLRGLDEIDATLARLPTIEAFEAEYFRERPWLRPPDTAEVSAS